ncbi:hypothetical protein GGR52DRAFT_160403 [Hypoxylon sp. FL1284]|nr:hypothetical protein GGR52DRAFT_160403 [Hypoxylon sp. FL1284]
MNRDGEHAEGSSLLSPASGLKRRWDSEIQWPGGIEAPDGTYIDPQKRRYVSGSTTLAGSVALGSSCWGEPIPLPSFPPALESTASTELTTLNSNVLYNIPSQPLSDSYELSTEQLEQYVSGYCQLFNYAGNANTTWSASGFPTSQVPVGWLSGQSSGSSEQNCVNSIETSTTLGSYNYDIAVSENLFPTQSYSGNQELAQHDVTDPPAHTTSADFLAVSNAGRQQHHNWSFSTDVSPYDSSQTPVISPPSVSAFTPGHHSQAPAFELQDPGMASASGENSRLGSALSPAQDASVFTASTTVSDPQDSTGLGKDQYEYDCCFGLVSTQVVMYPYSPRATRFIDNGWAGHFQHIPAWA